MSKGPGFLLKSEHQVIYAIVLILLIPVAIIINTTWTVNTFRKNIDVELQRQALVIARVFQAMAINNQTDLKDIQNQVDLMSRLNLGIKTFDILVPQGEDFKVIASFDKDKPDKIVKDLNYVIAWHQQEGIATLVSEGDERFWEMAMPLTDQDGQKQAILSLRLSLKIMDDLVKNSLSQSYLILAITIIIVILLLALNTRLFEHAILFKRPKEVDRMKDEFISIASHELRTPITTIKGFLSMTLSGDFGALNEPGKKSLKIMEASVNRLGHLVEDLLNVSRIEQHRLHLEVQAVDLSKVLDDMIAEFAFKAQEKGLTLKLIKPETALPMVLADDDKLRQVLINLIGNSIKYTKTGQVEVLVKSEDNLAIITIKDTGIGMSAEESQHLFEKFYRVKSEETQGVVGTGLGLWITKQLVELMGGKIFVESIKHVGTQVYFTIPIYNQENKTK